MVDSVEWAPLPEGDDDAEEEIRFAVVLNGGVSLAVWMGGVVRELDRLTRREGVYGALLTALRSRARADVIAGTSAGGINGGLLALSQVHTGTRLQAVGQLWAKHGSLDALLHDPWGGDPRSLLQGDDYFLPRLREAFDAQVPPKGAPLDGLLYSAEQRPIDLTLTTTLLDAVATKTTDSLNKEMWQPTHAGRFEFRRGPARPGDAKGRDDFSPQSITELAGPLALASRCTASFPAAFEPVFVTVKKPENNTLPDGQDPLHPNMSPYADFGVSRWVLDGGVLMNTPVRPVMDAISRMPAGDQTRRILLAVVPDPYAPDGDDVGPSDPEDVPTLRQSLLKVAMAPYAQNVAAELKQIQEHNREAWLRRASRVDVLTLVSPGRLNGRARTLFSTYQRLRTQRAAVDVVRRLEPVPADAGLATAVATRLFTMVQDGGSLPFLPTKLAAPAPGEPWTWGLSALERSANAVLDLLRRIVWLPDDAIREGKQVIRDRRAEVHAIRSRALGSTTAADRVAKGSGSAPERVATSSGSADVHVNADTITARILRGPDDNLASAGLTADFHRLVAIGRECARLLVPARLPEDEVFDVDPLRILRTMFSGDEGAVAQRLLALEVCYVCLTDQSTTGSEDVVELVRISADVEQPFAEGMSAEERVSGLRLGHFAAFLKESWRVNDWIWGRLDGANRLITTLLDPVRLHRLVLVGADPDRLLTTLAGQAPLSADVRRSTLSVLRGEVKGPEARAALQPLVDALLWHEGGRIVNEEQWALTEAVTADRRAGANRDSPGERWLSERTSPVRGGGTR